MKPLGEVIRRCGLRNHQYADDTQLYLSFATNPGEAVAVLNQCLAEVMGWMRANKLKLNPDKTEVLLGVLLDPELSLEAQVTAVARNTFLQLWLIHQLRPFLENDCLGTVTHVLVTSRLDFCNTLYVGLPLKMVQILQLVQNRAASLLTGTGRCSHITPVLRQLHWLLIEVRAQFKLLVMTYKALNGLGPGYLKERLHPYMPSRPLRSAMDALLQEPSMNDIRRVLDRNGSIIVLFNLSFLQWVSDKKIKNELASGIKGNKSELLQTFSIDANSIEITVKCLPPDELCADGVNCIGSEYFCDGVSNCPDGSDEYKRVCASLWGSNPGTIYIFSNKATVEFATDYAGNYNGFNATYTAFNSNELSSIQKINCTFEDGFCYWIQDLNDDDEWIRINGSTFPMTSGPDFDHTFGNLSGYYISTPMMAGSIPLRIRLISLPLVPASNVFCLSFWYTKYIMYHMYGIHVYRLSIKITYDNNTEKTVFEKEGNYGNNWNYGQILLNESSNFKVAFDAFKVWGQNDIAIDDIGLINGHCIESVYPEPTLVPTVPTTPLLPSVWYLNAEKGKNIQLHFQYFNLENIYDVVEIRDGKGADSLFLAVYTGRFPVPDIFSTTHQMTVLFITDKSGTSKGFVANFTTGYNLGMPACLPDLAYLLTGFCPQVEAMMRDLKTLVLSKLSVRILANPIIINVEVENAYLWFSFVTNHSIVKIILTKSTVTSQIALAIKQCRNDIEDDGDDDDDTMKNDNDNIILCIFKRSYIVTSNPMGLSILNANTSFPLLFDGTGPFIGVQKAANSSLILIPSQIFMKLLDKAMVDLEKTELYLKLGSAFYQANILKSLATLISSGKSVCEHIKKQYY
ncbi:Enteropeptidase [Varanus komodoensis]|nr:Enteropeptidase [Varanus komodoensis]